MELDLDFLKSLITDFDLMALLPDMAVIMESIVGLAELAVIVGPCLLAVLGLVYLIFPTKEANHFVGYRFFWGMGSVKSWRFTQRFAGAVWAIMGAVMAFMALGERSALAQMGDLDMLYRTVEILIDQIVAVVISCLAVNVIIFFVFNYKGNVRNVWLKLVDAVNKGMAKSKEPKPERPRRNPNTNK